MQTVAVFGLGVMGHGMAANLIKAGYAVQVYNRTRAKAESLLAAGAHWAETPAAAAPEADVMIGMVGDDAASRSIWLGTDGALAKAKAGATVIECSTLSLDWVRGLHAAAKVRGLQFCDAPVAGSKVAAEGGALTLFVGADSQAVFDSVRPLLASFSQSQTFFGPVGAGAIYKLVHNMLVATHLAALGEGLALAESAGLDLTLFAQALTNGASGSPAVKNKMAQATARDYSDVHFALRWMRKDVSYALKLANEFDVPLPVIAGVHEIYQQAVRAGLGDLDFSAVTEVARRGG